MHINPNIKCHFCNGNHKCRDCPVEAKIAPTNRRKVGTLFEEWVSRNIECPNCNGRLKVKGDHTPSLDLVCENPKCLYNKFECKSKCLSVNCLPNDIFLPHGTHKDFIQQINKGLNLIVVIYGFDRISKTINVREVIHADNKDLINPNLFEINRRNDSNLSSILIKDRKKLKKMDISNKNVSINISNSTSIFN
jgi:hypothetical protein